MITKLNGLTIINQQNKILYPNKYSILNNYNISIIIIIIIIITIIGT